MRFLVLTTLASPFLNNLDFALFGVVDSIFLIHTLVKVLCNPRVVIPRFENTHILKTPISKQGVVKRGSLKVLKSVPILIFKSISMMGKLLDTTHHRYAFEIWNRDPF